MNYEFTDIKNVDYIGNSLSAINTNYKVLEYWTNNIILSSNNYFQPLLTFYTYFGDFWKSTINYAFSINAPARLSSFRTTVETNSAFWVKPISFFYPTVRPYNVGTLNANLDTSLNWFKTKFPVLSGVSTNKPRYAENTRAFLYCLFYNETVSVNETPTVIASRNCSTQDRSAIVDCYIIYLNNVACYSTWICPSYSWRGGGPTCKRTFSISCNYENNQKSIVRSGIANINNYFKDRSEYDHIYCLQLIVKNCDWTLEKIL